MSSVANALNNRLDYLVQRQAVVSGNVANANTPGYVSRDLTFAAHVKAAGQPAMGVARTNSGHMAGKKIAPRMNLEYDTTFMRHDGNSVKLDEEMQKLNQIRLNYNLATQLYSKQKQLQQLVVQNNG